VYRDSAGGLRESNDASATAAAMLPTSDFTAAQAAMARLPLPFRNIIRDPFVPSIGQTAKTTAYPQAMIDAIQAKGCSSFRIINPNSCAIRFRGATGVDDLIKEGGGPHPRPLADGSVLDAEPDAPEHYAGRAAWAAGADRACVA